MTIDATGKVFWLPGRGQAGINQQIVVKVSDGQTQGLAKQTFTLSVQPPTGTLVTIPNLVGLNQIDAEAALSAAGLNVGTAEFARDLLAPYGNVIAQDLPAGRKAVSGVAVTPTISLGWEGVVDPNLLPPVKDMVLRTNTASFNAKYAVIVKNHRLFIAPRDASSAWRELRVPPELDGKVWEISMDDQLLVATNEARQIYSLGLDAVSPSFATALKPQGRHDLISSWWTAIGEHTTSVRGMRRELDAFVDKPELWTKSWGSPFAIGKGINLPMDTTDWSLSVVSPWENGYYTDAGGRKQNIGAANCTTVFALNDSGRRITVLDPWLPTD